MSSIFMLQYVRNIFYPVESSSTFETAKHKWTVGVLFSSKYVSLQTDLYYFLENEYMILLIIVYRRRTGRWQKNFWKMRGSIITWFIDIQVSLGIHNKVSSINQFLF